MPLTATPQKLVASGLTGTYIAADAGGHKFANDERVVLHIKNGSGSSVNVTIDAVGQVDGVTFPDLVVAVGAGADKFLGPFSRRVYNSDAGEVSIAFSATTSVTFAVLAS